MEDTVEIKSHSLSASKHSGHQKRDNSPPKQILVPDEKASSMPNLDDSSRPTSAPPKLYSNDPFGYFTKEPSEVKEEEQYNIFNFNRSASHNAHAQNKPASYSRGDAATLESKSKRNEINPIAEAKSDLDISDMLSRQNSSVADGRFSPDRFDPSSSKAFMEVLDDGFGMHDNHEEPQNSGANRTNNSTHSNLTPTTTSTDHKKHITGENRSRGQKRSKGNISPRKIEENHMYGSIMAPQVGYMQTPYYGQPNQPYMNMMPPDYHYMMAANPHQQGLPGYPVQMMNYYPYGVYPPNNQAQAPSNYENTPVKNKNQRSNNMKKGNQKNTSQKEEGNNKGQSNSGNSNNGRKKDRRQASDGSKQKSEKVSTSQTQQSLDAHNTDPQELERLIESASRLAKDQAGCRMLQKQLELNDPEVTEKIFDKVIDEFAELMVDPFGNYLCQKLAEACTRDQMEKIIQAASTSLINICFDPHGTRAVQKLIELVKEQDLIDMLVEYLAVDVVGLIKDNNGNHVIQKCLTHMSDRNKQFIYDSIMENCVEIATHKHGCCVIQRCLDHASKKQKEDLIRVIVSHTYDLVEDQYGNYVIQYVLELKDTEPGTNERVAEALTQDIVGLCKQKFSSNVVEKCLHLDIPEFKKHFMETLLEDGVMVELICDQFGNYVLQRYLTRANEQEMKTILQSISDNAETIKNDVFGFKIYTKLCKNYSLLRDDRSKSNPPHSPLVFEEGNKGNQKGRAHSKAQSKQSTGSNKKAPEKRNNNKNERRQHNNNTGNNSRSQHNSNQYNSQQNHGNHMNYQQPYHMNQYGHPMPGPMMYPSPMQTNMMPPPGMMQPDYYLQNSQMYNQFYNYPPPQSHQGLFYGKNH